MILPSTFFFTTLTTLALLFLSTFRLITLTLIKQKNVINKTPVIVLLLLVKQYDDADDDDDK